MKLHFLNILNNIKQGEWDWLLWRNWKFQARLLALGFFASLIIIIIVAATILVSKKS